MRALRKHGIATEHTVQLKVNILTVQPVYSGSLLQHRNFEPLGYIVVHASMIPKIGKCINGSGTFDTIAFCEYSSVICSFFICSICSIGRKG